MFENFDWIQAIRTSPVMLIILACSVMTFGLAIERLLYYGRRSRISARALTEVVERARKGELKEAAFACGHIKHPFGPVGAEMLKSLHQTPDHQEERMSIALSEQRLLLERNLGFLGTMGNTAPLIGLLGTVWGIMRAFHDMARTGSAGPSVVAAGVAEALFTTAAGLVVAVPAVMLYNHFLRSMGVILTEAENQTRRMRQTLEETHGSARKAA
jgi:biopolymer transport protein ExbB